MSEAHKLMPQQLRPAEDVFRLFFDMIENAAAICDSGLRVLAANSAFRALVGTADVEEQPLSALVTSAIDVPGVDGQTQVDVRCKTGQAVKLRLTRRGGMVTVIADSVMTTDLWREVGRALMEHGRNEEALLSIGRDVVASTSEEELVAVVARGLKSLFHGRMFCIRVVDPKTCALTSLYAEGKLLKQPVEEIVLRASAIEKTNLRVVALPKDKMRVVSGDIPLLFAGSVRSICAPFVSTGQLLGAINIEYPEGLSADVLTDERMLIQLANQVSVAVRNAKLFDELVFVRKYLEDLIENANALICAINCERRVIIFNNQLTELLGYRRDGVLGRDVVELIAKQDREKFLASVDGVLSGEHKSPLELGFMSSEGREVRVAMSASRVVTQMAEVEGVMFIGHDLTRMRDLERHVVQAEKLASMGRLAASVAHEINNPMTAVSTYADALYKKNVLNPAVDKADNDKLKRIVENSDRVLRFTHDLVSYSRPASEKTEDISLEDIVRRAIDYCEHVGKKHGVSITAKLNPVRTIKGVKQNLVQVFVNLVTNACHASVAGGSVEVILREEAATVCIDVKDNGSGIAPETIPHLFEPFFTTKEDGKGTGLGLAIVHNIVERHGGKVQVDTALGKGTTFSVVLPFQR